MLLEEWLSRNDTIAHTSDVYGVGFSKHAVAVAVRSCRVLRVRRSWIALPEGDPVLRTAICAGGRLTCVSEARR